MSHRKFLAIGVIAAAIAAATGVAHGATEASRVAGIAPSQFQINPKTCRFLHREIDPVTPKASLFGRVNVVIAINDLRTYSLYEDMRHDVKMSCLSNHMGQRGPAGPAGARGPAGPAGPAGSGGVAGYVQVKATGTGASVTATCPTGDVVLGGGSPDETTGSYPSSQSSWTVNRDHLSPRVLTVIATCARAAK